MERFNKLGKRFALCLCFAVALGSLAFSVLATTEGSGADIDGDGVFDSSDNCPNVANSSQNDADSDGFGDACDNSPYVANPDQADQDGDKVGDVSDNCISIANLNQLDSDNDKVGDACDNCPVTANANQMDDDHDGIGNACDQYNCVSIGVEICNDSIDNDCDGYIDNADSSCADSVAPTSTIEAAYNYEGVQVYNFGDWSRWVVNLSLSADDGEGVGVDKIYYCSSQSAEACKNREEFFQYSDAVTISENGTNYFSYYSVDVNGNNEAIQTKIIKIDQQAPSGGIGNPSNGDDVSGSDQLLTVGVNNDGYSDINNVCVWFGDYSPASLAGCSNVAPYNIYWNTQNSEDRTYKVYLRIEDKAGNVFTSEAINLTINNAHLGTIENPALIATCQDLQNVGKHLGWYYILTNDIDCSATNNWNSGAGFLPMGDFSGIVDGKNFTVSNLYMNTALNSGIFNSLSNGGKITSLNFRNLDINCQSTYCGVLTNMNFGTIEKTSLAGKFACNGKCGGFASQNSGSISQSWADLLMSGSIGYGGILVGQNYSGTVENCYAKGRISAGQGGGIIGLNERWIDGGWARKSYSNALVTSIQYASQDNGGVFGWQYQGGTQADNYWNKEISGKNNMCGSYQYNSAENCNDEAGLTDAQMKDANNFINWDFEDIWAIDADKNNGYPYLRWQTSFSNLDINTYTWQTGEWSVCTAGLKTRTVACRDQNNNLTTDNKCSDTKPSVSQSCEGYSWFSGEWSACNVSCGGGIKTRTVVCRNGENTVADNLCLTTKPAVSEACNQQGCGGGGGSGSVILPFDAPVGGFKVIINNGASETETAKVNLSLVGGSAVKMTISNNDSFVYSSQEPYADNIDWQLSDGYGLKAVYVKFFDKNGTASPVVKAEINLKEVKQISNVVTPNIITPKKVLGEKIKKTISLEIKKYSNGTLLRAKNKKIYVIVDGKKKHIRSLKDLRKKYFGKPIINVSDDVLNQY